MVVGISKGAVTSRKKARRRRREICAKASRGATAGKCTAAAEMRFGTKDLNHRRK